MLSQKTQQEVTEAIYGNFYTDAEEFRRCDDLNSHEWGEGWSKQDFIEAAQAAISAVLNGDEAAEIRKISKKVADYLEVLFDKGRGNPWAGVAADELLKAIKPLLPVGGIDGGEMKVGDRILVHIGSKENFWERILRALRLRKPIENGIYTVTEIDHD